MANQYTKKKCDDVIQKNKSEIKWNLINSLLAGALVFLGSLTTLKFEWQSLLVAFIVSAVVAITKFKDYWDGEKKEYQTKIFRFL